jgi:hypothetical protein
MRCLSPKGSEKSPDPTNKLYHFIHSNSPKQRRRVGLPRREREAAFDSIRPRVQRYSFERRPQPITLAGRMTTQAA